MLLKWIYSRRRAIRHTCILMTGTRESSFGPSPMAFALASALCPTLFAQRRYRKCWILWNNYESVGWINISEFVSRSSRPEKSHATKSTQVYGLGYLRTQRSSLKNTKRGRRPKKKKFHHQNDLYVCKMVFNNGHITHKRCTLVMCGLDTFQDTVSSLSCIMNTNETHTNLCERMCVWLESPTCAHGYNLSSGYSSIPDSYLKLVLGFFFALFSVASCLISSPSISRVFMVFGISDFASLTVTSFFVSYSSI